jgi:four helix bundle protein
MYIEKFEDAIVWQKAGKLTLTVYNCFHYCKDQNFKYQINKASVSIMNNIAEGFERRSNNELKNFLYIAKGSCGEVRSMLYLGIKMNYINTKEYKHLMGLCIEVSKCLSGWIKAL